MRKKITTLFLLAMGAASYAQGPGGPGVGIGAVLPNASAMLDVEATNKGVLMPRISLTNAQTFGLAGGTAVDGMIVYNTNDVIQTTPSNGLTGAGYYYWTGGTGATGRWEKIADQTTISKIEGDITNVKNEISNITGGGSSDLSYLIRFRPAGTLVNGLPSDEDKMFYLKPQDANPDVYDEIEINDSFVAQLETKTMLGARSVLTDGTLEDVDYEKVLPSDPVVGEVYFEYLSEEGPYYVNVTAAIIESVTNNETLRENLTTIIKNVGGSVFYGPVVDGGENVLYELLPNGDKKIIDLSETISEKITEILNNTETKDRITELIKEVTRVEINNNGSETGEVIDGKMVYKAILSGSITAETDGPNYNSKFAAPFALTALGDRVLSVTIFDNTKKLVMSTVTDVNIAGGSVTFRFGVGNMYQTLPVADGYQVIFEYVSTVDKP